MILILVVVEEGLVRTEVICTSGKCFVLILIVVEDGLVLSWFVQLILQCRLNPYCSGRWSRTLRSSLSLELSLHVLILIVVEDGLVRMETICNCKIRH